MHSLSEYLAMLDRDELILYMGAGIDADIKVEKSAVMFSHELSRTGAPCMLLNLAEVLRKNDYQVMVVSQAEDDLLEEFTAIGVNVIIYPKYLKDIEWLSKVLEIFSVCIANTLICAPVVQKVQKLGRHIFWWIHENELIFTYFKKVYENVRIDNNVTLVAAGPYVQNVIKEYMREDSYILNFGIKDAASGMRKENSQNKKRIRFIQVGTFNEFKGQEILADAISKLDKSVLERCDFTFCGDIKDANIDILDCVRNLEASYSNVHIIPSRRQKELYSLYRHMDVFIIPSKIETTSAVMVEALMMQKIGICSDACGVCRYLTDGKDSLIFKSQDSIDLKDKIEYIVNNFEGLDNIRLEARKVYENVYSMEVYEKNLLSLLE